jgi:hypothetical protein
MYKRLAGGLATLAVLVPGSGSALAQAPSILPNGERVAHDVSEVPADWIAAHPEGGCAANPFLDACGAPGHPIRVAYFPSAAAVNQQDGLGSMASGDGTTVSTPNGGSLTVVIGGSPTATTAKTRPRARAAAFECSLHVYAPDRANVGGNIKMESVTSIDGCAGPMLEVNACSDLYQRTTFVASGCDPEFTYPYTSVGHAIYDCGHSDVIQYRNAGTGYAEDSTGAADFNSGNAYANHSCT